MEEMKSHVIGLGGMSQYSSGKSMREGRALQPFGEGVQRKSYNDRKFLASGTSRDQDGYSGLN